MDELDPETKAWLAERAKIAELERAAVNAALKAKAHAPGVSRPGPGEAPLENWQEMYGPDGQAAAQAKADPA